MILFEKLKQNFCKNFVGKTNIIMETDRESRKCATIAHLTMSLMCFLRQLRWTPCSADPIKMSWSLSRWFERLQFISMPLTIRHSHIFQNTPCLPPKILQKHCFQLLLGPIPRRKYQRVWKNKRGAKFGGGGGKQGVSWEMQMGNSPTRPTTLFSRLFSPLSNRKALATSLS